MMRPEGADRLWPARDDVAERFVHSKTSNLAAGTGIGGSGETAPAVPA